MAEVNIDITTDIKTEPPDYDPNSELFNAEENVKIEPEDNLESTVKVKYEEFTDVDINFISDNDVEQADHDNHVKSDVFAEEAIESYDETLAQHAQFTNNLFVKQVFVKEELGSDDSYSEDNNYNDPEGKSKDSSSTIETLLQTKKELQIHEENEIQNCVHCDDSFTNVKELYKHCVAIHSMYICYICIYREFKSQRGLAVHIREVHWDPCKVCRLKFPSDADLLKHCHMVHVLCKTCNNWFGSQEKLSEHVSMAHCCSSCGFQSKSEVALNFHKRTEHNICDQCNQDFLDKVELALHEENNHKIFRCKQCEARFSRSSYLNQHRITAHPLHWCSICSKRFESKQDLAIHIRITHRKPCRVCLEDFATEIDVLQHCENKHVLCKICKKWFMSLEKLAAHESQAHRCSCGFESKSVVALKLHKRKEHNICDRCNKEFPDKIQLVSHEEKLHGVLACPQCDARFNRSIYLNQHRSSTHPVYLCTICNMCVFNNENSLAAHISAAHRFPCKVCLVEFTTENDLLKHCKTEHLFCIKCKNWLMSQENLTENASKARPNVCFSLCGMECKSNGSLKIHKRKKHSICDRCNSKGKNAKRKKTKIEK